MPKAVVLKCNKKDFLLLINYVIVQLNNLKIQYYVNLEYKGVLIISNVHSGY